MKCTWLGQSAFRLEFDSSVVLIDPFLTHNPTNPWSVEKAAQGVTHIVITHGHDDHIGDSVAIAAQSGAQIISNYEVCTFLAGQGATNINPGNTGGTVAAGDFTVSFTQALHSAGVTRNGVVIPLGSPNGIVLKTAGGESVYHMGDTDIFGDMALINEIHQPQVGIVPVGDRFTMGGAVAALACKRFFNFKTAIPCHYATFGLLEPTADKFVAAMAGHATKVLVLTPGEEATI